MDEQKLRQIIRGEIQANDSASRFALNQIPRHIHNGTDSPPVFQPTVNYAGYIGSDAVPVTLPKGWTSEHFGTGMYIITHNLGTNLYSVMITPTSPGTASTTPDDNSFQVNIYSLGAGPGLQNTSFQFVLTQINNRSQAFPIYVTTTR